MAGDPRSDGSIVLLELQNIIVPHSDGLSSQVRAGLPLA